jgi:hypothetical protein
MFRFGKRSMRKLVGVNPLLALTAMRAIGKSKYDFGVFEGIRTVKRQKKLLNEGRSWTMRSKHITGNAIDLVPYINGKYVWDGYDADLAFEEIYRVMNDEAERLGCRLVCGISWKTKDKPHYQLSDLYIGNYNYAKFIR